MTVGCCALCVPAVCRRRLMDAAPFITCPALLSLLKPVGRRGARILFRVRAPRTYGMVRASLYSTALYSTCRRVAVVP